MIQYFFMMSFVFCLMVLVYMLFKAKFTRLWARILFIVSYIMMLSILFICGLGIEIDSVMPEASRRTVVAAVDISASTGIDPASFKDMMEKKFRDYNVEIFHFSNALPGIEGAQSSAILDSYETLKGIISNRYNADDIASFVLVTDGNETKRYGDLSNEPVPAGDFHHNVLYISGNGSGSGFDKAVKFTGVPRFIPLFKKQLIKFGVSVTGRSLEGVPVNLRLNGKDLGSVYVKLKDGYGEGSYEIVVNKSGLKLLEADVAVDDRERVTSNNRDYSIIEGVYEGLRVLHLSGRPSVDTATMRSGLQNIPGVDMISFFILRKPGQINMSEEEDLSLIPFPTDQLFSKEIENFDLIIVNDFRMSEFLSPVYISNISRFVEDGGALLVFGGRDSFKNEDYMFNGIGNVSPVYPLGHGADWEDSTFRMKKTIPASLTPLRDLDLDNVSFKGRNLVGIRDWGRVFIRDEKGNPVAIGGLSGKGRVLVFLTDSFWHLIYHSGKGTEHVIKSMTRYLLGLPVYPVAFSNDSIVFESVSGGGDDIAAVIDFADGKKEILRPGGSLRVNRSAVPSVVRVRITESGVALEDYDLVLYKEDSENEMAFVPIGRTFLQKLAEKGGGDFILSSNSDLPLGLDRIIKKDALYVKERNYRPVQPYRNKYIILALLLTALSCFYLKSRYA